MRCGAVYEYDWGAMRRTRRQASELQGQTGLEGFT